MKILIQGRKNGYSVLYPTLTPTDPFYAYANDIQSISASNNGIYYGKCFYTLAFAEGGCIFTKYVFGDDKERGQLGEIGISVFIPSTQKLRGSEVKTLLDELVNIYCRKFISDNKIIEPHNGFDWLLFTSIADSYDAKLLACSSNYDNGTPGKQDPAFHYYKSETELIELLDRPFQEEYSDYKQILFIDNNLQGDSNPLKVLKNSGVEVNPDLINEYYYLNNYNKFKGVKIAAYYNNKWNERSDGKGNNQIRAKWQVEIKYSKDDRCYEPINLLVTISDLTSDDRKYLEIKGNQIMVNYDAFNNPNPKKRPVAFEIKDRKGKGVEGAEIQIGAQPWATIYEFSTSIDFQGEDIVKKWTISAKKISENLYSNPVTVTPDSQFGSVILTLQEKKVVKIYVIDKENGNNITNFKFWCNDGKGYRENASEIIFVNDDIYKTWNIEVSKKEGWDNYLGKIEYYPATGESSLIVRCQKTVEQPSNNKTYRIAAGEHGKKANNCPRYSNSSNGSDLDKTCIIANKGYAFNNNWELNSDILVAQYEKKKAVFTGTIAFFKSPSGIAISVISVCVLVLGIWALESFFGKPKEIPLTEQRITAYVEGDSLFLNTLNDYKRNWILQEKNFITKSGGGLLGGLFGGKEQIDSVEWKSDWQPISESIDSAITKRELLKSFDFAKLKKIQRYPEAQKLFIDAIKKIDSTKYSEVGKMLGVVSTLTLTKIADTINAILTSIELKKPGLPQELKKENPPDARLEHSKEQPNQKEQKPATQPAQQKPATTKLYSEIFQYIIDSELDEKKLMNYKNTEGIDPKLKSCIELCTKIWSLNGDSDNSYSWMQKQINTKEKYNTLKNSALKSFLDKMCETSTTPKYWNEIKGNQTKDKTLKNLTLQK